MLLKCRQRLHLFIVFCLLVETSVGFATGMGSCFKYYTGTVETMKTDLGISFGNLTESFMGMLFDYTSNRHSDFNPNTLIGFFPEKEETDVVQIHRPNREKPLFIKEWFKGTVGSNNISYLRDGDIVVVSPRTSTVKETPFLSVFDNKNLKEMQILGTVPIAFEDGFLSTFHIQAPPTGDKDLGTKLILRSRNFNSLEHPESKIEISLPQWDSRKMIGNVKLNASIDPHDPNSVILVMYSRYELKKSQGLILKWNRQAPEKIEMLGQFDGVVEPGITNVTAERSGDIWVDRYYRLSPMEATPNKYEVKQGALYSDVGLYTDSTTPTQLKSSKTKELISEIPRELLKPGFDHIRAINKQQSRVLIYDEKNDGYQLYDLTTLKAKLIAAYPSKSKVIFSLDGKFFITTTFEEKEGHNAKITIFNSENGEFIKEIDLPNTTHVNNIGISKNNMIVAEVSKGWSGLKRVITIPFKVE